MKEALHIHNFPPELRREIKAQAAKEGKSIKDWVIKVFESALNTKSEHTK